MVEQRDIHMRRSLKRGLIAGLTLAICGGVAVAQWTPPATIPPPAPSAALPSMAGINLNDNGYGIMAGGVPWIRFNNQTSGISAVTLGKYAGINLPDGQGMVAIGEWAMASQTLGSGESIVISPWGMPYGTVMRSVTAIGEHVGGAEVNPVACTVVGADVLRDTVGCNGGTVFGSSSVIDGNFVDDTVVGSFALHGTVANVVIGVGTPNPGDIITVNLTTNDSVNTTGFPVTVTYTVVAGDTTATLLAQHVHAAIDASSAVSVIRYTKPAIPNVPVRATTGLATASGNYGDALGNQYISFHVDGTQTTGMQLVVAASCSGVCPNAISATGASSPAHNTLMGRGILANPGMANPQYNTLMGYNVATDGISLGFNTIIGANAGQSLSTDASNTIVGAFAGQQQTGANNNTMVGKSSGAILTSGGNNTFFGLNSGNKMTTGASNLCLGFSSCSTSLATGSNNIILTTATAQGDVDTASRSNLINIGGVVKFQNSSLGVPVVTACGTSPVIDANANNVAGTVTVGTASPASCTITFAGTGYRVFNHCQVTTQSANVGFGYSYSLTAITLTGSALTGKVDYWCSGN